MPEDKFSLEWPGPEDDPGTTKSDDIKKALIAEYNDRGAWARHYSTVRMTLGTFFLLASIGVIYQRWDKGSDPATVSAVWGAFAVGSLIFGWFSLLTFLEMNAQRRIVRSYRSAFSGKPAVKPKAFKFYRADALYFVFFTFVFLDIVLAHWPPAKGEPNSPPPPASASHFTVVESAIHQTTHGREAHTFLMDQTTGDLWQMICAPDGTVEFKKAKRIE